jgi:hypothetical protein
MPTKITKVKGGFEVSTPNSVHAKHTTLKKAKAQERLLNAIDHGWKPKHHSACDGKFIDDRRKL